MKSCKILPLGKSYGKTAKTARINLLGTLKSIKGAQQHREGLFNKNDGISVRTLGFVVPSLQSRPALPSGGLVGSSPQSQYQREQKALSQENAIVSFDVSGAPCNTRAKGLFLVPLLGTLPQLKLLPRDVLVKTLPGEHFILYFLGGMLTVRPNNTLTRKQPGHVP